MGRLKRLSVEVTPGKRGVGHAIKKFKSANTVKKSRAGCKKKTMMNPGSRQKIISPASRKNTKASSDEEVGQR